MATLPDYTALGGVPDANSGRPIASARSMHPGALAAGVEQLGSDLQTAGSNIDAVAQREKRQDNLVQVANADADSLKRQQELHQTVTSDNDYATQPKRYEAGSNAIIQSSANAIADPRMRQIWIADAQKNSVARLGVVESQAATGVKQNRVVQGEDNLKTYQSIIANPATDEATRQQAQENVKSTITAYQNEGVITPDGAAQWKTSYVDGSTALLAQARTKTKDGNAAIMTPATPSVGPITVTGVPSGTDVSKLPAGMKNNNPGNLKFTGAPNQKADYPGIVGPSQNTDQGSPQIVFQSAEDGMTAMGNLALKKFDGGMKTADALITTEGNSPETAGWTPKNKQAAANVAKTMGVSPDAPINLRDPKQLSSFMHALIKQEHGSSGDLYPQDLVAKGATRALSGDMQTAGDGTTPIEHPAPGPGGPRANFANVQNMGDPRTPGWEQQNLTTIQAGNGQSWQVNKKAAEAFQGFLKDLEAEGYNPKSSGGYNYRTIRGGGQLSQHAFGTAIDIGAAENPMGTGPLKTDLPANVSELAAKHGLVWGGDWKNRKDPMHFEWAGGAGSGGASATAGPDADPFSTAYGNLRSQYPSLSAAQIYALANEAVSAHNSFKVEDRASLEGVVQDAPAAIQTTGGYDGVLPTRQQFADAYGAEGQKKYDTFQAAIGVSKTVHDMLTMPAAQIQATVDAARPTNSGAGAELDLKKSEAIQSAAASTLAAREKDPASYTLQAFPAVKQAWGQDGKSPQDFATALRLTAAAQTQLGIPADKQALIPKGMETNIVNAAKDETKTPADRLGALSSLVLATPDRGQRQALVQQLVKAGLPQTIDRSIDAAARGDTAGAQLLFAAATVDPAKLPGTITKGGVFGNTEITAAGIDKQIQADVLDPGKIGDAVYGLSDGNLDNTQRAANDGTLLRNGVKLEMMHNGGDLPLALQRVSKAIYGDLKVVNQGQVAVAAPSAIDENKLVDGLALQKETVRQELDRFGMVNEAKTPQEKQIAKFAGMDKERHIQSILDNGTWRNVGDGYGLFDKTTGLFVAGPDGKPFVVTPDAAVKAADAAVRPPASTGPAAPLTPEQYRVARSQNESQQRRKETATPSPFGASTPSPGTQPQGLDFGGPDIPAAANPAAPPAPTTLPPPTQDQAASSIQRTRQIQTDERRKKAGLPPFYKADIPQ